MADNHEYDNPTTKKRLYARPEIKQVDLKPEEAILGFCKTGIASGPGQARCSTPVSCSTQGS